MMRSVTPPPFEGTNKGQRSIRNFLIYKEFQLRLVATLLIICASMSAVMMVGIAVLVHDLERIGQEALLPSNHGYFRFLSFHAKKLFFYSGMALGIASVFGSVALIVISHKVAGPLVRLKSHLVALRTAHEVGVDLPTIRFREGDFFSDLPPILNETVETLTQPRLRKDDAA